MLDIENSPGMVDLILDFIEKDEEKQELFKIASGEDARGGYKAIIDVLQFSAPSIIPDNSGEGVDYGGL